jgi:alpha-L-fucosidase
MSSFRTDFQRPPEYQRFERPVPAWFTDAKLGIFVHWGAYSVPAWAEPTGELGTIDSARWYRHNPYAEWYANTVRIEGSGAWQHQREVYGGASYERFLDDWRAERFDPDALMQYFADVGARYFVPTTKHHDGITLWDAPGTDDRNTVARGPRRDLVAEFAASARRAGMRFGVYYSGGLDWHFRELPPISGGEAADTRPVDADYAEYAYRHVVDLIDRYRPDLLWGDIEWPDAGKPPGPFSLVRVFERFYAASPDGVVNDRWGETHCDFRTSEYQAGLDLEAGGAWENCRGMGLSFGYNRMETAEHTMDGPTTVRHFVDVVSRGGNLLLDVGLTAAGEVPELQRRPLDYLGAWNRRHGEAVFGSRPLGRPSADPIWNRWTASAAGVHAIVDAEGDVTITAPVDVDPGSATTATGDHVSATRDGDRLTLDLPPDPLRPTSVRFARPGG